MATSYGDGPAPSRDCNVPGCGGKMRFNSRRQEAAGFHTLEWPWRATWVCDRDAAHFEVATAAEESAPVRGGGRR